MIDLGEIEQATRDASPSSSELSEELQGPSIPVTDVQTPVTPQRTGEHTNIQKTYRLTPTALKTIQELSRCLSASLEFEINNSSVIRSILWVVHNAISQIHEEVDEQIITMTRPSTAIGNEHLRDELETRIASIILNGISRMAQTNRPVPTRWGESDPD